MAYINKGIYWIYVKEKCHWKGLQAELDPDFTLCHLSFIHVSSCCRSLLFPPASHLFLPPFFCTDFLLSKVANVATASPGLQLTSSGLL